MSSKRLIARRLKSSELKRKIMRKDVREALESAIAGFEKRQHAEQERLRERERFENGWAQIRTAVVLPALEDVAVLLRKAGWQCEVRAGDKDPSIHFTVYREVKAGISGGQKPFMTYQPEKQKKYRFGQCSNERFCCACGQLWLGLNQ